MRFPKGDGGTPGSSEDFDRPAVHMTGAVNGTVRKVREHDVIWLVSQLKAPWGTLPPGIDARIEVKSIERSAGETRFVAGGRSGWVPLRDATALLQGARVALGSDGEGPLWTDPARPIGHYLQSMRELRNADEFERWYQSVCEENLEFVSYRQLDGTADAFSHVAMRLSAGKSVFWDRWSLPRGIAERREEAPARLLDPYVKSAIDRAGTVWGIDSPRYGEEPSYSAYEKRYAGSRLILVPRSGKAAGNSADPS
jgi:hypothetical protein